MLRLLLLTGARKGAVLAMRWASIDLTSGVWTKTLSDTKQKRPHRVPLNDAAVELLRGLRAQ
ncbi:MAG: tyrosine-type recombinase/integrase, partial [Hyphomicrobium sp.]